MYRRTKQLSLTDNMPGLNIFKNIMLDGGGYAFIAKVIIFLSKRKMGNTYFVHHEFNFQITIISILTCQ